MLKPYFKIDIIFSAKNKTFKVLIKREQIKNQFT